MFIVLQLLGYIRVLIKFGVFSWGLMSYSC